MKRQNASTLKKSNSQIFYLYLNIVLTKWLIINQNNKLIHR